MVPLHNIMLKHQEKQNKDYPYILLRSDSQDIEFSENRKADDNVYLYLRMGYLMCTYLTKNGIS